MKTLLYKAFLIALLIPIATFATDNKGKYTKEKKIKKEFKVSADATLKISNSYGHVNVTSWNENRIVIEVHVKTSGDDEEKVQRKLEEIDVNFDATNSLVSARTVFEKNRGGSWWKWDKNNNANINVQINYTVKMPVTNNANLNNDYGSISLDKLEGVATISCDYGKLSIGDLMANGNYLNFDYTSNSTIDYMKSGKINADYSGFTLEKSGNISVNADYTKSIINEAANVDYNCSYGSLKVAKVNDFEGTGDYLTTRLGTVDGNVNIRTDYGSIRIEEMTSSAGNIDIRSDYTGIKIGHNADYQFDFEISLEYAGLGGGGDFEFDRKVVKSSDKYYEGFYGKRGSGNRVIINSSYGSVRFEEK